MPLRTFPLNLRPSWQKDKFLPSRGMKGRLETELSTGGESLKLQVKEKESTKRKPI